MTSRPIAIRTRHLALQSALFGLIIASSGCTAPNLPALAVAPYPPAGATVSSRPAEEGYAELAAAVMPTVVNVRAERRLTPEQDRDDLELRRFLERHLHERLPDSVPQPSWGRRVVGEGSGFIISPAGYIVTAYHVAGGADSVWVTLSDGTVHRATLVGEDQETDLVLIRAEAKETLPYAAWGDSDKVRVGDKVIAVGNPFGLSGTVTAGIISATTREIGESPYEDLIQIDAPINRGNSGGPTFNMKGEVIGVNTAIVSPWGGSIGIGFAVAANQARQIVEQLMHEGAIERGYLGLDIQSLDQDLVEALGLERSDGVLVARVHESGPAARAGIRQGDVILAFGDERVEGPSQLRRLAAASPVERAMRVTIWRDAREQILEVKVGRMPTARAAAGRPEPAPDPNRAALGLSLTPLTPDLRQQLGLAADVEGVVVAEVSPDSAAAAKDIEPGDLILAIGQTPVRELRDALDALRQAGAGGSRSVLLLMARGDQQFFTALPLPTS
jgi:serine protease Do